VTKHILKFYGIFINMSEEALAQDGLRIVLWIFLTLLLGALIREANKKLSIPYTPTLLFIGLIWGITADWTGELGASAIYISKIYPVIST
jgi:hypothetical protein